MIYILISMIIISKDSAIRMLWNLQQLTIRFTSIFRLLFRGPFKNTWKYIKHISFI